MKKQILLIVLAITGSLFATKAHAQLKLGTNPTVINGGSILEMESTTRGMLMPRIALTTTTTWGLAGTAVAGMTVYNTNAAITSTNTSYPKNGTGEYYWDGTGWVSKKASGVNNGLLDQLSISAPDGTSAQFIIPVDLLVPSANLKVTYSFYTTNDSGASQFQLYNPSTNVYTDLGGTGPCGGGTSNNWFHATVIIARPASSSGMLVFQMLPNIYPGCQTQNLQRTNIVVQPID